MYLLNIFVQTKVVQIFDGSIYLSIINVPRFFWSVDGSQDIPKNYLSKRLMLLVTNPFLFKLFFFCYAALLRAK